LQAVEHGGLLKLMLRKMSSVMNNPPFNYMIHPSPLLGNGSELAFTHCFILLIPLLIGIVGFELGMDLTYKSCVSRGWCNGCKGSESGSSRVRIKRVEKCW